MVRVQNISCGYPTNNQSAVTNVKYCTIIALSVLTFSCTQYPYDSPQPGVLEVYMKTSSQQIQSTPGNQFFLEFFLGLQKEFRAIRADGVKFLILDDLHAIRRENPRFINVLDSTAVDSSTLLGQTYVPPSSFVSLDFSVQPLRFVLLDGYR